MPRNLKHIYRIQVEIFWVMTQCGVAVGHQRFAGPHYTASQPRGP